MAQRVLVDTDVLIDFGRDMENAVHSLAVLERSYELAISVIVAMELYAGCRSKQELKQIDGLLEDFSFYHITTSISEQAFEWMKDFRASHGVEINDLLIAATAHINTLSLISKNRKHYKFLPGIDLLDYPFTEA